MLEYPLISNESVADIIAHAIKNIFPVGAIQINTGADPNEYLYGTWVEIGKGQMLVGFDPADADFTPIGKTGGSKTHTLLEDEIPAHIHRGDFTVDTAPNHSHTVSVTSSGYHSHTGSTDTDTHNHSGTTDDASHYHAGTTSTTGNHSHTSGNSGASILSWQSSGGSGAAYGGSNFVSASDTAWTGNHNHTFNTDWRSLYFNFTTNNDSHYHSAVIDNGGTHNHNATATNAGSHSHTISGDTESAGEGNAHNNMPPYLVVKIWQRVA